jgi:hypothetical protein
MIGMIAATTPGRRLRIRPGRLTQAARRCAAARGTAAIRSTAPRSAAASTLRSRTTTWGSGAPRSNSPVFSAFCLLFPGFLIRGSARGCPPPPSGTGGTARVGLRGTHGVESAPSRPRPRRAHFRTGGTARVGLRGTHGVGSAPSRPIHGAPAKMGRDRREKRFW